MFTDSCVFSNQWYYRVVVRWGCLLRNHLGLGRCCSWGQGLSWWWVYGTSSCGAQGWQWGWRWPCSPGSSSLHLYSLVGPERVNNVYNDLTLCYQDSLLLSDLRSCTDNDLLTEMLATVNQGCQTIVYKIWNGPHWYSCYWIAQRHIPFREKK